MLSATSDVSNESIAPSTASTNPALSKSGRWLLQFGALKLSPPSGIEPMRGRSSGNSHSASGVISRSPNNGEGITLVTRLGAANTTTSVAMPTATAAGLGVKLLLTICSEDTTPPWLLIPNRGPIWRHRMITPIPDMNPETTE
ncbi:MAG: Uncharacterised protein [Synechococcus sp. MIT S9220]|nr:MAG: Uncharacterised protein [Synechococcus sp. MIT S9220]